MSTGNIEVNALDSEVIVITPREKIRGDESQAFESVVMQQVKLGKVKIIIDMRYVSYIDSVFFRILADALTQVRERRGDIKVVHLRNHLPQIFRLIGFDRYFDVDLGLDTGYRELQSGTRYVYRSG